MNIQRIQDIDDIMPSQADVRFIKVRPKACRMLTQAYIHGDLDYDTFQWALYNVVQTYDRTKELDAERRMKEMEENKDRTYTHQEVIAIKSRARLVPMLRRISAELEELRFVLNEPTGVYGDTEEVRKDIVSLKRRLDELSETLYDNEFRREDFRCLCSNPRTCSSTTRGTTPRCAWRYATCNNGLTCSIP